MRHIKHIQINILLFIIVFFIFTQSVMSKGIDESEIQNDSLSTANTIDSTILNERIIEIPVSLNDTIFNFNLTSEIFYTKIFQFKTIEGKEYFVEGWKNSEELNKLFLITDSLRNEYVNSNFSGIKASISSKVLELESQTINTSSARDFNYMKAREFELSYWNEATELEKWQLFAENDSIKKLELKKVLVKITEEIVPDSIDIDTTQVDSTIIQTEIPVIDAPTTGIIIFKVQIGAYNTELPESAKKLYKKISMLRTINQHIDERNYTIYTIGEMTNIKDAIKLQEQIRQESVKDAFVIAYKQGKRIPLNEALESTK